MYPLGALDGILMLPSKVILVKDHLWTSVFLQMLPPGRSRPDRPTELCSATTYPGMVISGPLIDARFIEFT